jgi:hypothetical protein
VTRSIPGPDGWVGFCPVCGLLTVGRIPVWRGSWCFRVAPRMARHLWDEHPYEATVLMLRLSSERSRPYLTEADGTDSPNGTQRLRTASDSQVGVTSLDLHTANDGSERLGTTTSSEQPERSQLASRGALVMRPSWSSSASGDRPPQPS